MDNTQLKELVNRTTRPDKYKKGDRVIFRTPDQGENHSGFDSFKRHVGRIGTLTTQGNNTSGGTTNIKFDTYDEDQESESVARTHWVELYFG